MVVMARKLMPTKLSPDERRRSAASKDPRQMVLPIPENYRAGLIFPTKYVKTLEERIESLPRWAQKHIANLESELNQLRNSSVCGDGGVQPAGVNRKSRIFPSF